MTSLIAWIGVDSRGPASAYFASDSRITWPGAETWDHGRKLFSCRRFPAILGYCGDVLFPTQTLSQITELIDADLLFSLTDDVEVCTQSIIRTILSAFGTYPRSARQPFEVLYCMREGDALTSRFHVRQIMFSRLGDAEVRSIPIPDHSAVVSTLGSGSQSVRAQLSKWISSEVGGTSRAVFSAFCDSLRSGQDPSSAGPPQLVGLWRKGEPRTYGIISQRRRYFYGTQVAAPQSSDTVQWYNELFEICDPVTLERKADAQRQPRPRGL